MKKRFILIATILLAVAFALCGCKSYEDMVPESLGAPEGLWLYKGNERMRTDGSERERILQEVVLDGETFTEEEYFIRYQYYCTETGNIFYVLEAENDLSYAYMYDYLNKTGKQLSKGSSSLSYSISEHYFLVEGAIYTRAGELLASGIPNNAELDRDLVYYKGRQTYTFWRAGEFTKFTVRMDVYEELGLFQEYYAGDYLYLIGEKSICAINFASKTFEYIKYDGKKNGAVALQNSVCFLATERVPRPKKTGSFYNSTKLYVLENGEMTLLYTFKENLEVFYSRQAENVVNFSAYDFNHKLREKKHYKEGQAKLSDGVAKSPKKEVETLVCGEYTFWMESEYYWGTPIMSDRSCYYLYRKHGDEVEIMQYCFGRDENWDYHFYDDIREV